MRFPRFSYLYLMFIYSNPLHMNSSLFYSLVQKKFPFQPTYKQDIFFQKIAIFLTEDDNKTIFVLKGYAGKGKTTVISTIVNNLADIHKKIYFPKKSSGGGVSFTLQQNKHKNTIFIVDEASMISDTNSDSKLYESSSLLDDLISYVYSGTNCKMILLGGTAQLPPVNLDISPALDIQTLSLNYNKEIEHIELDEVMRQEEDSGILRNATELRELLKDSFITDFQFDVKKFKDIVRLIDGYDIQDAINSAYSNYSIEDTAFIVRSHTRP